ncbi:putative membrane protein YesL [Rhizobium leguminosarum]|uniref:Membrane protein YesL n=1 Tax=Rhizobium leguminosarum TaxID=384 RepID=A0AAE2MNG2_RHILE|nr:MULTISPECIES: YesL family protein [Rhizobium]MBB4292566.1 putative membrane protein YesL [Rhizobium leguminosarum]MBB4298805.1 putative membrane protein YesL [Rhizobium leguminosarum]MBB4310222.1 putative membrane protein YesL [Rhizobium leguminosarum]MBB4434484.1 putative membrane protein YesL [Rhizobium esperanzae]MBB4531380.1 putative membrane protein YesL [Rhizobium leguminosarum]
MQWLRDMWTKEGPGIAKDAPKRTGLALFAEILVREWWEMVKLNILFIVASLLVVTLPAALVAMARVSVALVEDRNTYLLRDFTDAFLRYFWRATAWGLALGGALAIGIHAVVTYAAGARDNLLLSAPLAIALVATAFVAVLACHLIVLMVMRDLPALRLLRLAALASVIRPLPALAALAVVASLWLAHILFYPVSVFMPATFNFSLGMFAVAFGVHRATVLVLDLPEAMQPHRRFIK